MKILKDNYRTMSCIEENADNKMVCEHCASELEYDGSDIKIGEYGLAFVKCPLCGYDNYTEDRKHDVQLTMYNVEFPTHFYHISKETGAVDCIDNEEIKKCICQAIDYFRKNKDEVYWFTEFGNLYMSVSRWEGDESYDVVVTGDHYDTTIPFEKEDYRLKRKTTDDLLYK